MKKMSFSCGEKVYIQTKTRTENGIVCRDISTVDKMDTVRVIMENGKVVETTIGKIIKR